MQAHATTSLLSKPVLQCSQYNTCHILITIAESVIRLLLSTKMRDFVCLSLYPFATLPTFSRQETATEANFGWQSGRKWQAAPASTAQALIYDINFVLLQVWELTCTADRD